jgi:dihydrofolate reductase
MRKTVLYIAMSLDGYIADSSGGVAWLAGDGSDPGRETSYPAFLKTVDTVLLGYTTYHQLVTELAPGRWEYEGKTTYVFTHRKLPSTDEIRFTDGDPAALVRRLRQEEGKDIWVCGGASVVNRLINDDCIDEYIVTVIPVVLGDGIPLFSKHERNVPLRLIRTETFDGMVGLVYERRNKREPEPPGGENGA